MAFLRAAGFALTVEGDRLFVRPRERLSDAEAAQVQALKPGLLAALAEERWKKCDTCLGWIDGGCDADVKRLCVLSQCPLKPQARRKR